LDSTLIIWGGEFGRTPFREATSKGNVWGATTIPIASRCGWQAWVGGGYSHGKPMSLVLRREDKTHVHDLQATIMHLLGFDHTSSLYRFQGRDYRLTDVHGTS